MCTKAHYVYNRYIRKSVLVNCGKCEACLQEKAAARSNRIRNNFQPGTIALFCTFTYAPDFVPYIRKSKLIDRFNDYNGTLYVYRDSSVRWIYNHGKRYLRTERMVEILSGFEPVDCGVGDYYDINTVTGVKSLSRLKSLVGSGADKVGVLFYKDMQDFYKRLRQNLSRNYGITEAFSTFTCGEYGSCTQRPHFHSLIFIRPCYEAAFRDAIVKSWPFADKHRTKDYIEVAKNAASYVSSYVNSNSCMGSVLSLPCFRPSHHYSKNFGVGLSCFSLASVLSKTDRNDLRYRKQTIVGGAPQLVDLPIPKYVINRYFPRFLGDCRFDNVTLALILQDPVRLYDFLPHDRFTVINTGSKEYRIVQRHYMDFIPCDYRDFSNLSIRAFVVRLCNCQKKYMDLTGKNSFDYAIDYMRVWTCYRSTILKDSYRDITCLDDLGDFYENWDDVHFGLVDVLTDLPKDYVISPNLRRDVVLKTSRFEELYHKLDKQRKVTNFSMSRCGHYV